MVDTHVKRLAQRLGLTTGKTPEQIERELMRVIPRSDWVDLSHRLIQHGRRVCLARRPRCEPCSLATICPKVGVAVASPSGRERAAPAAEASRRAGRDAGRLTLGLPLPDALVYPGSTSSAVRSATRPKGLDDDHAHPRYLPDPADDLQLRVLPAQDRQGLGRAVRRRSPSCRRSQPSFVSVTYGAGGSTRERTHDLIVRIQRETNLTAVSHLTCVCHTGRSWRRSSTATPRRGSRTSWPWAATRPATMADYDRSRDAFQYAEQLVAFIRSHGRVPDPRGFGIGVAGFPEGHPGTPNRLKEMDYLKRKVDAGAD